MRLAYWMYQGTAHHGVGRITNSMRGVHAVFHAPQGDDYVTPIFAMLERSPAFPQMTVSVVSGRDLSRGTLKLPDTLHAVEREHQPDLIIVTASCSTILLQENLEQIVADSGIHTEAIVYDANPYRMQEVVAADRLFTLLVQRYATATERTTTPSVNILGPASLGFHARQDLISLRRMLAALGVQVNVVAPWGATVHDLARLPAAWLTLAPYRELGHAAAQHLDSTFGMTTLYDAPIGVQPTLAWLHTLLERLNAVGERMGSPIVQMPPLNAFSLDGMSAPSGVPWFARTADMESFSGKRAFVFGDATHTVGVTRFLQTELGMQIVGVGTYLPHEADWIRAQLGDAIPGDLLVTEAFQDVARVIEQTQPDLVCGTQMERHSGRKHDIPTMVIAPPTHIENHLLGYYPILGFDGADVLADRVYTTTKLGLEKHLVDMFGDAGLDYEEAATPTTTPPVAATNGNGTPTPAPDSTPPPPSANGTPTVATDATHAWTDDAEAMLKKIPFFVRGRVRRNVEQYASEHGYATITLDVLREAREALGG